MISSPLKSTGNERKDSEIEIDDNSNSSSSYYDNINGQSTGEKSLKWVI